MLKVVGHRIRELRNEKKLNQEKLAEKIGVTRNYVGMIERGEIEASLSTLRDIAKALDTPLSRLFSYTEILSQAEHDEMMLSIFHQLIDQPIEVKRDVLNQMNILLNAIKRNSANHPQ